MKNREGSFELETFIKLYFPKALTCDVNLDL